MLTIRCDRCGNSYRVDENAIKGEAVRFKCKACENILIATKPRGQTAPRTPAQRPTPPVTDDLAGREELPQESGDSESPVEQAKKRSGFRFGLTARLVTWMLLISLIPLVFLWIIQFRQISERLRTDVKDIMGATDQGIAGQVEEWVDKNARVLEAAALLPEIINMDRKAQEPILRAIQQAYPWIYLVFTIDKNGMNIARSDQAPLIDYSDRQYYKDVMQGKAISWQTLIGKTSNLPALILAIPIKSDGKVVGVLANAMTVQDISQKVATWRQGKTGFAFLVDEKGKVIAHPVKEYYLKQKDLTKHPLVAAFMEGRSGAHSFIGEDGKSCLGYASGTKFGWVLGIQQEEKEALSTLFDMQRFGYLFLALTIGIVLIVAWFLGRSFTRPIKELTDAADRMSVGELNVELKPGSRDEIGQLTEAIGRMQDSLRLFIERMKRR